MGRPKSNANTNIFIRNIIVFFDFLFLNLIFYAVVQYGYAHHNYLSGTSPLLLCLLANAVMIVAQNFFMTIAHERRTPSELVLRQVVFLLLTFMLSLWFIVKAVSYLEHLTAPAVPFYLNLTLLMAVVFIPLRFFERFVIKHYRRLGRNTRNFIFIGSDPSLVEVYNTMMSDATTGYKFVGYYADSRLDIENSDTYKLGDCDSFWKLTDNVDPLNTASFDELYCSISVTRNEDIKKLRRYCDANVIHFYYVPMQNETISRHYKVESIGNVVAYTNYEYPLASLGNRFVKRAFDLIVSSFALLLIVPFIPIIWLIIKIQSPGPLFFKQARTGMNGKEFMCYKFRSMHVNKDADLIQATENDPRKFAFGNFMRKANIDELPQFFNVFKGDMSIVGPRPHMLHHTEVYANLIAKYMVRHFVKPGVTGWAQVTGFRGETKELWQMEGRVQRDLWYIENWSLWLDIRIMYLTFKQFFVHDEKAY